MVHDKALPAQEDEQAAIAEAAAFSGQCHESFAQPGIVRPPRLVADRHPLTANCLARPPLAHLRGRLEMGDSFPLHSGRHHFFESRSFKATLSSMASANSRFNLPFSVSSALSRLASDTSMPPNLLFQL